MVLRSIISKIAVFSKLCGHMVLETGSFIGRSVIGHLMLIRSLVTSRSDSSSSSMLFAEV